MRTLYSLLSSDDTASTAKSSKSTLPYHYSLLQYGEKTHYFVDRANGKLVLDKTYTEKLQRTFKNVFGKVYIEEAESSASIQNAYQANLVGKPFNSVLSAEVEKYPDGSRHTTQLFGAFGKTRAMVMTRLDSENNVTHVHIEVSYPKTGLVETIDINIDSYGPANAAIISDIAFGQFQGDKGHLFYSPEEFNNTPVYKPSPYEPNADQSPRMLDDVTGNLAGKASILPLFSHGFVQDMIHKAMNWLGLHSYLNYGVAEDRNQPEASYKLRTHFELLLFNLIKLTSFDSTSLFVASKSAHPDETFGQVVVIEKEKKLGNNWILQVYVGEGKTRVEFNIHVSPNGSVRNLEVFASKLPAYVLELASDLILADIFPGYIKERQQTEVMGMATMFFGTGKRGDKRKGTFAAFNSFRPTHQKAHFEEDKNGERFFETPLSYERHKEVTQHIEQSMAAHGLKADESIYAKATPES